MQSGVGIRSDSSILTFSYQILKRTSVRFKYIERVFVSQGFSDVKGTIK